MKTITFIFNKAPTGSQHGRELLDIALMSSAFDMPVRVIFQNQGAFQLLKAQEPERLGIKNHSKTFKALELYGINEVYIDHEFLKANQIESSNLITPAKPLAQTQIKQIIKNSDFVIML